MNNDPIDDIHLIVTRCMTVVASVTISGRVDAGAVTTSKPHPDLVSHMRCPFARIESSGELKEISSNR